MHTQITRDQLQASIDALPTLSPKARERLQWLVFHCENGASVRATCEHFSLTLVTFYRLLHRFDPADPSTLEDRSRRPHSVRASAPSPVTQMPPSVTVQISAPSIQQLPAQAPAPQAGHAPCANQHCLVCALRSADFFRKCRSAFLVGSVLVNAAFAGFLLTTALLGGRSASADVRPALSDTAPRQ